MWWSGECVCLGVGVVGWVGSWLVDVSGRGGVASRNGSKEGMTD
jgi:hypothetical protein